MLYVQCAKLFDEKTPIQGLRCLVLLIAAASLFVANGCKSSDKPNSWTPFFGGSPTDPATQPLPPLSSEAPIVVSELPGPAMPTQSGLSSGVTSSSSYDTSNSYVPPDLAASSGTAVSNPTSYSSGTTMVYSTMPGTKTNAGGVAGSLPNEYSASSSSETTSPNYTYETSSSPYTTGSSQTSGSSNGGSSSYGSGSTNDGTSGYGNGATTETDYYHGPLTGHSTSISPERQILADGDYMAADGTKYRVINGKQYELVQYSEVRTPDMPSGTTTSGTTTVPNYEIRPGGTGGTPSYQPPVYESSTPVPMTTGYRTAIQMTEVFARVQGQVPVPTYDAILGQQNGLAQNVTQGIITIGEPVNITILPAEDSTTETVASIDHADYSEIGAMIAPATSANNTNSETDREMQNSFWSIMARQDNNYLLFGNNLQQKLDTKNQPMFYPLIDPLGIDSYQKNLNATVNSTKFPRMSNPYTPVYVPGNVSVFPNQSCFGY